MDIFRIRTTTYGKQCDKLGVLFALGIMGTLGYRILQKSEK